MARDTGLLTRAARTGECVFSVYSWSRPTISFGRNQPANGAYDRDRIRNFDLDVVRRPTGGRAILHHREVTYSVTAPLADWPSLRETYDRINAVLQCGLASLGVTTHPAMPVGRPPGPSVLPCFESPTQGELVASGAKLVGSAQWRDEKSLLQHGSILVDDDQSSLLDVVSEETRAAIGPVTRPATLTSLLGRPPGADEVAAALFEAIQEMEDENAERISEDEIREDTLRHVPQYLDEEWTWRR
jgi:lipoate-protein ligase A